MAPKHSHPVLAHTLDFAMKGLMPVRRRIVPWAAGDVLEIGCGTGANFPLYRGIQSLVGIEPDPHMRRRAQRSAASVNAPVTVQEGDATSLDFPDRQFDTVVATFVLCTIDDPARAASEMARVLRDEGTLIFAEHVCAKSPAMRRLQRGATPAWAHVAGGCRLDNDAMAQFRAAGFSLQQRSAERHVYHPFPVVYGLGGKGPFREAVPGPSPPFTVVASSNTERH